MIETVLHRLVEKGMLHKGARILCLAAPPVAAHVLARAGCAATVIPAGTGPIERAPGSLGHDVILTSFTVARDSDVPAQADHLRAALFHLRPGGHIIAFGSDTAEGATARIDALATRLRASPHHNALDEVVRELGEEGRTPVLIVRKKTALYTPQRKVTWVDTNEALHRACARVARETLVGLDVETTLWEPRILCTVQLATETEVFVTDALALSDLAPIKAVMETETVLKVIHNRNFEQKILGSRGISIENIFDTLQASRKKWRKGVDGGHKLGEVCERELRIYLDKSLQASDWTSRPLTQKQMDYAAADAEVLLTLYRVFAAPPKIETMDLI